MKSITSLLVTVIISFGMLISCSTHEVDNVQKWCEQISGEDLADKYQPFWAILFAVKFNGEAIRDDYVRILNTSYLEKVEGRTKRMAWREGTEFHVINLSSFFEVNPEVFIEQWRTGVEMSKQFKYADQMARCQFGTLTSAFDSLHIHSMTYDPPNKKWTDNVTVIPTDRNAILGNDLI